jgi:uncharacterized membrane protein SirB2
MITSYDINITKHNLLLHSTLLIISNIVLYFCNHEKLFNNQWIILFIATIIAYIIHGFFINKIAKKINNYLSINHKGLKKSISDIFQYASVYTLQRVILTYFNNQEIILDVVWFSISSFTILGYIVFNLFNPLIYVTKNYMINDIIKITVGFVIANFCVEKLFPNSEPRSFTILLAVLSGLIFFHSFVNKYLN